MNSLQADLAKVKARSTALESTETAVLSSLIGRLEEVQQRLGNGSTTLPAALPGLLTAVQNGSGRMSDAVKEVHNPLNKLGKSIDKKFSADLTHVLPPIPDNAANPFEHMYFSSPEDQHQIDQVIADHLVRTNADEDAIRQFVAEAGIEFPQETFNSYCEMHNIGQAIEESNLDPALAWVAEHQSQLNETCSPLEFALHRSYFMHCLLSNPLPASLSARYPSSKPGSIMALQYARDHFQPFYTSRHLPELSRLLAASLYSPSTKLSNSPYADLLNTPIHATYLVPLFQSTFAQLTNLPLTPPLKTLTDIGGGGALSKLAKVRSVMKETRTGWSASEELPVEIPTQWEEYRFHSVFACPVSKEQTTELNPPMMLPCGHVIAKESLNRLSKGGANVKCPYCPASSAVDKAMRVYF